MMRIFTTIDRGQGPQRVAINTANASMVLEHLYQPGHEKAGAVSAFTIICDGQASTVEADGLDLESLIKKTEATDTPPKRKPA